MRRSGRWLAGHAVLTGVAWIPLVFAFWAIAEIEPGTGLLPDWLLGATFLTGAVVVVPLIWPLLIVVAWFEGGLAERVASGDSAALRAGIRLLRGVGLVFAALGAAAAVVARLGGDAWLDHQEFVTWAWTGPVVVGAAHLGLARALAHSARTVR
jgi:hypothetical protein